MSDPQTVRELYFWIKDKLENLENKVDKISHRPDYMGKWVVRVIGSLMLLGQGLMGYKIFFGG